MGDIAGVSTAGYQDHIRPELLKTPDPLHNCAVIIYGKDISDYGPCAQSCPVGALRGHRADDPRHQHLQAATGAGGGDYDVYAATVL